MEILYILFAIAAIGAYLYFKQKKADKFPPIDPGVKAKSAGGPGEEKP